MTLTNYLNFGLEQVHTYDSIFKTSNATIEKLATRLLHVFLLLCFGYSNCRNSKLSPNYSRGESKPPYGTNIIEVYLSRRILAHLQTNGTRNRRHDSRSQVLHGEQQTPRGPLIRPEHARHNEDSGGREAQVGAEVRQRDPGHRQLPVRGGGLLREEEDGAQSEGDDARGEDPVTGDDVQRLGDDPGSQGLDDAVGKMYSAVVTGLASW